MASRKAIRKAKKQARREGRREKFPFPGPRTPAGRDFWAEHRAAAEFSAGLSDRHQRVFTPAVIARARAAMRRPALLVRWIGAYRQPISTPAQLRASVAHELSATDEKSASYQLAERGPLGSARVGLLIDLERSSVSRIFSQDAYTETDEDGVIRQAHPDAWWLGKAKRINLEALNERFHGDDYYEVVGRFRYSAIIIASNAPRALLLEARRLASRYGLRVAVWEAVYDATAHFHKV